MFPCPSPATPAPARRRAAPPRGLGRLAFAAGLLVATAHAAPLDARLLDAGDDALAADVAWLVDRRVLSLPLGTWPLPAAALRRAMDARAPAPLPAADAAAMRRLRAALARLDVPAAVRLGVDTARHPALDGAGTVRARSDLRLSLQPPPGPVAMRLRLGVEDEPLARRRSSLSLAGSYLAVPVGGVVASLGLLDRRWGPGTWTSPLLSDAAPPMPALTVRRLHDRPFDLPLLEHLGPWGVELSVAQLQDYHPRGAHLLGLRSYLRPAPWIEVGAARHIFWGGRGRPSNGRSLLDALLGRSNVDGRHQAEDPSNELAGFDLRLSRRLGGSAAASAYAHLVGEDEAGHLPSHLFGLVGLQFKHAVGGQRLEWTLEAVDTETSRLFGAGSGRHGPAYAHGVYRDGYYHLGLPLGAHIGGGGRSASLGVAWVAPPGGVVDRLTLVATGARTSEDGADGLNRAFSTPGRLRAATLRAQGAAGPGRWSLGLSVQRHDAQPRREAGIAGTLEWPLGGPDGLHRGLH